MILTLQNIDDVFRAKKASVDTMEAKGYTLIDTFFVDNSGLGIESEPALLPGSFLGKVKAVIEEHGKVTAKLINVGQFQVYVGLFKKTGKSKSKKVANNTIEIDYGNGKTAIRLHNTDILIFDNGTVTLDSGGWQTHTTKRRLNRFLPGGYSISQKNFEWFVNTPNGEKVAFSDGMTLMV